MATDRDVVWLELVEERELRVEMPIAIVFQVVSGLCFVASGSELEIGQG